MAKSLYHQLESKQRMRQETAFRRIAVAKHNTDLAENTEGLYEETAHLVEAAGFLGAGGANHLRVAGDTLVKGSAGHWVQIGLMSTGPSTPPKLFVGYRCSAWGNHTDITRRGAVDIVDGMRFTGEAAFNLEPDTTLKERGYLFDEMMRRNLMAVKQGLKDGEGAHFVKFANFPPEVELKARLRKFLKGQSEEVQNEFITLYFTGKSAENKKDADAPEKGKDTISAAAREAMKKKGDDAEVPKGKKLKESVKNAPAKTQSVLGEMFDKWRGKGARSEESPSPAYDDGPGPDPGPRGPPRPRAHYAMNS